MENLTWENSIVPQWVELFDEAANMLKRDQVPISQNIFNPVSV